MKQLIIESNGVKTILDVNNINQLIREQGKLILKLADGKEIILNQSDVFSIELLDNNQGIISINSLSQSDEIDELEKLVEGDKISWFEENKALSYAGGALLVGGIVAAASSGGSSSDNGDYDPPSLLTQSLAADHKTVTGQTEAGATVKAMVNGKVVGSAVAGADGKYSLSLDKAYLNGEKIGITATDAAGNTTKANTITAPDTTAPSHLTQSIAADGQTVVGKTEAGATVTVTANGKVVGTAVAGADGNYSVTLNKAYLNGEALEVVAKDQAGNATKANSVTAPDTTAPAVLTQMLAADHKTVTGQTEAGATVKAMVNGKVVGSAVAGADGKYSLSLDKAYLNGEKIGITATDAAGNTTKANTITAPDTTAPSHLTQSIAADGQTVVGKTEAGATVTVTANGKVVGTAVAGADGNYSVTLNKAYLNGEVLEVVAKDQAGNATKANTITAPDTTAPAVLTQSLAADHKTVTGQTEAGATVKAMVNGKVVGSAVAGADGKYSLSLDKAYLNGEKIEITATDAAGNTTKANTITAPDTTAPSHLTQSIAADGQTVVGKTEAGATVTVTANGKVIGTAVAGADGNYSVTLNKAYLNGEALEVVAKDQAGNATKANSVTAPDTTAPVVLTQTLAADHKTVTGQTEAGATVKAMVNGKVVGSAVAGADGKYSLSLDKAYLNGEKIEITAADQAGNAITQKLYAPIADLANSNAHFELEEAYQIEWNTQQVSIQNEQNYSSLSKTIQFEVTGDNGSVVLNLSNSSYSIHGSYYFKLSGPGMDSSSSGGISSIGSGYDSKVIGSGLKAGHYTLTVQVNSPSTLIELDITQNIQVEEKIFDGYQQVSGNVFADDSGQIKTPENYMLQVGKQKIIYQSGIANAEPIIHQTEHGTLTLNADGSYRYQSKWTEQGTAAKGLNDQLNIKISSLDGRNSIDYALKVTTDITPPIAGEIIFTDFNNSGISDTDFITNDQEFSIDIQGNEQGSFVEYQYSTDQGQTWSLFEKEMWSYFEEGQYSFRAKVTDAVGNESYTAEKQVTVDITGPDLQNLFSYDVQNDYIIFNPPEESYQLTQWVAGQWVEVDIKAPLAWTDSSQYKVMATDFTGNTTEQIIHIAQISGVFKPENSAQINVIKGSEEDDYLYGGDGDDTLISYIGSDRLYGGAGNDTLIYGGLSKGYMSMQGEAGDDTYIIDKKLLGSSGVIHILDNASENNVLQLKSVLASEIVLKDTDSSYDILFNDSSLKISVNQDSLNAIQFDDGTIWDKEAIKENIVGRLVGTESDDILQADDTNSVLYGLGGDDFLKGGEQDDYLYGGDGDDTLISYIGSDRLYGGAGNDTLIYGGLSKGYMSMQGEAGDDTYIIDKKLLGSSGVIHILDNASENNVLQLKSVLASEIVLKDTDSSYDILFNDSSLKISVNQDSLNAIQFDDGTIWDKEAIKDQLSTNSAAMKTSENVEDSLLSVLDRVEDLVFDPTTQSSNEQDQIDLSTLLSHSSIDTSLIVLDLGDGMEQFTNIGADKHTQSYTNVEILMNTQPNIYDDLITQNTALI